MWRRCRVQRAASKGSSSSSSSSSGGYRFFEDYYPKPPPPPAASSYATYEEQQQRAAVVKRHDAPPPPRSERDVLHHLHTWQQDRHGYTPPPEFGWPDDWGPAPGEDGHDTWYTKPRCYMSYDEKCRYDIRMGVPVERNSMRHQELPYQKRMKAASYNLEQRDPQFHSLRQRNAWAHYSYEDQRDTVAKARDEYISEWLAKPGVTRENVGKAIADHNGTATHKRVVPVERRPEWELAPLPERD